MFEELLYVRNQGGAHGLDTPVILSGVAASRNEAAAQSKDPYG
jgi:hypothetical protein